MHSDASPADRQAIEPPSTVSLELQAALRRGKAQPAMPWPTTNAAWRELVRSDAEQRAIVERLLAQRNARLVPTMVGGVPCYRVEPLHPATDGHFILHLHEGGYVFGAGLHGVNEAILLASAARLPVLSVDYRMPPDFPFPAALDDAMAVWCAMARMADADRMTIAGTSSGGALALALVQRLRIEGGPMPAALAIGSPWSDLSKTGDSYRVNAFGGAAYEGLLAHMARLYAGPHDLKDPRLSPVYGRFDGFPPTILTSGTRDLFLSNTVRVDEAMRRAGVETRLQVLEGQVHAAYLDPALPESTWVFSEIACFLRRHCG
nr:alpha/beta hydrolase [Sphingomonas sp. Y57]